MVITRCTYRHAERAHHEADRNCAPYLQTQWLCLSLAFDRQLYKRGSMPRAHFHASVQNNDVSDFRRRVYADVSTYMGPSVDRTVGGFERLVGSSYDNAVSFIVDKVLFLFSGHLVKFESALLMVLKKCSVNEFDLGHGSIDAFLSRPNIAHAININGRAFSSQLKAAVPRAVHATTQRMKRASQSAQHLNFPRLRKSAPGCS